MMLVLSYPANKNNRLLPNININVQDKLSFFNKTNKLEKLANFIVFVYNILGYKRKQMKKPKVAILYIALGRYICFWKDFYLSCEKHLLNCEKHYFIWTDNTDFDFSKNKNVTVVSAQKKGWPYDSLLRFEMFLEKKDELQKYDYMYFFNANMEFINDVDLSEIAPHLWHDSGIVAGVHPGKYGDVFDNQPDKFPYERRSESTAYIPFGCGKHYVCGAFNGGTSTGFLKMCAVLSKNVRIDIKNNINACVDDESHLNAYLVDKEYLLCGQAYGFPEAKLRGLSPKVLAIIKIISRHKEDPKYGGAAWLRGKTDKKMPDTAFTRMMIRVCRVVAYFIPNKNLRHKVRGYFGS